MISNELANKILDNAPEGAEYYGVGHICCYYKNVNSKSYLWCNIRTNNWVLGDGIPYLDIYPLSELSARFEAQLDTSVEWLEGDVCTISEYNGELAYGCDVPTTDLCVVFRLASSSHMTIPKVRLTKPLTPAQIAANQNLEWQGVFHNISLTEVADILIENGITVDSHYSNHAKVQ